MLHEKVTILIVDDDASLRDMLKIILQKEGYGVQCAEDARSALSRLKKGGIDLVVSDIKMPDIETRVAILRYKAEKQGINLPTIEIQQGF